MTIRKTTFAIGEFYHIFNRGNSKQKIFLDDKDKDRFVKLLYLCNSNRGINFKEDIIQKKIDVWDFDRGEQIVSIGAWELMTNHFHLYITISPRQGLGDDSISSFVHKLCTAYSMYFNKKHERTGSLFEGKFKSIHVTSDEQAKYLFSYIHLNSVEMIYPDWKENGLKNNKEALEFLNTYKWSSYHDYRNTSRPEGKILTKEDFPDYFSSQKVFDEEIFDWLNYNETLLLTEARPR